MSSICQNITSLARPAARITACAALGYMIKGTEGAIAAGAYAVTRELPDNNTTRMLSTAALLNAASTFFGYIGLVGMAVSVGVGMMVVPSLLSNRNNNPNNNTYVLISRVVTDHIEISNQISIRVLR